MATTRFYLDLRGKAKDGRGSVLITLFHNHSTSTFSTGVRIEPQFWNGYSVYKTESAEALNAQLAKRKMEIDREIALMSISDDFNLKNATQIKQQIEGQRRQKVRGHLISVIFDEYMSLDMKPSTRSIYDITKKKVLAFAGDKFIIENLDYKWLVMFDKHLAQTQCANGRSIYLRALKRICNYAIDTGIQIKYPFQYFKIKQEQTKKRCIEIDKLCNFYKFPTTEHNAIFRDYFFLQFYLIGINIVDLLYAKKSQVVNGRLEYIRRKTGKFYSIKIEPEAQEIIDRYAGEEYLIKPMEHYVYYKSFLKAMNKALKNIGPVEKVSQVIVQQEPYPTLFQNEESKTKIKPLIPDITTYYTRHSWATIAADLDISSDVVAMALGHSPVNKTTFIYIKPDPQKVDEANRKVIDYFKASF